MNKQNRACHNQLHRIDKRNNANRPNELPKKNEHSNSSLGCKYACKWFSVIPKFWEIHTSKIAHLKLKLIAVIHCFIRCHFIWSLPNIAIGTLVYYKIIEFTWTHFFSNGLLVRLTHILFAFHTYTHKITLALALSNFESMDLLVYLLGCVNQTQDPHN